MGTESFQIGTTYIADVVDALGEGYDLREGQSDFAGGGGMRILRYWFDDHGIAFFARCSISQSIVLEELVVDHILVMPPLDAVCSDGVALGDDVASIMENHGPPDDDGDHYSDVTYHHYRSKGLSFKTDDESNTVVEIQVYEPGTFPEDY